MIETALRIPAHTRVRLTILFSLSSEFYEAACQSHNWSLLLLVCLFVCLFFLTVHKNCVSRVLVCAKEYKKEGKVITSLNLALTAASGVLKSMRDAWRNTLKPNTHLGRVTSDGETPPEKIKEQTSQSGLKNRSFLSNRSSSLGSCSQCNCTLICNIYVILLAPHFYFEKQNQ